MMTWHKRHHPVRKVYQECTDTLNAAKPYVFSAAAAFLMGVIVGAIFHESFAETLLPLLKDLVKQIEGLGWLGLAIFIFHNNFTTAVITMLTGGLFFLLPYFHAIANGILVGFVLQRVDELTGSTQWWKLLPHGIFEIPAFFMALGLGVYLGLFWRENDKLAALKTRLIACLKTCALVIAPLLTLAAMIESSLAG